MSREKGGSGPSRRRVPQPSGSGTAPRFFSEIKVGGVPLDEVSSAVQKHIRRGHEFEAAYWIRHLVVHGFGRYAIKKLSIVAAEDVGLGDPQAVILANALLDMAVRVTGKANPTGEDLRAVELHLVGVAVVLARARHSRLLAEITCLVGFHAKHGPRPEIPAYALDVHTRRGRSAGLKRGSQEALRFWQQHSRVVANDADIDGGKWRDALDVAWKTDPTIGFVPVESDADGEG